MPFITETSAYYDTVLTFIEHSAHHNQPSHRRNCIRGGSKSGEHPIQPANCAVAYKLCSDASINSKCLSEHEPSHCPHPLSHTALSASKSRQHFYDDIWCRNCTQKHYICENDPYNRNLLFIWSDSANAWDNNYLSLDI